MIFLIIILNYKINLILTILYVPFPLKKQLFRLGHLNDQQEVYDDGSTDCQIADQKFCPFTLDFGEY